MYDRENFSGERPISKGKNEKKEFAALAIGFLLILLVIIITLFKNAPKEKIAESKNNESAALLKEKITQQETINAKDLQKKLITGRENGSLILLDVRPFEDYAKEHIIDSTNVTPEEFPASLEIDARSYIIVIGANSNDSNVTEIVEKLKKEKVENISVLAGGIESWRKFAGQTVTYGDPNSFVDQAKVSYVDSKDLDEALKEKVPMFILDVRNENEFSKGHVPEAKNIPFDDLEKRRKEITEKKVVVVGRNELEEFQASVQMYDMLLVSPYILRGAMPEWEKNAYPLEK